MNNRIVKHSSRYSGPAGDSRPPAEIFAGIAAREKQATEYADRLRALLDEIMRDATLMMWESRAQLVRNVVVEWLTENDPDFAERAKEAT
jgi:hypothetical protein